MSYKIHFRHNLEVKIKSNQRDSISFIQITNLNFLENQNIISKTIETFNSEIEWDKMWNLDDANIRLTNGEVLYILLDGMPSPGSLKQMSLIVKFSRDLMNLLAMTLFRSMGILDNSTDDKFLLCEPSDL